MEKHQKGSDGGQLFSAEFKQEAVRRVTSGEIAAAGVVAVACSRDKSTAPSLLQRYVSMDRQSAGTHGKLRIVTNAATHTVTLTSVPADLAAAAPTRTLSAADTARLDKVKALCAAAWKITPMVAMLDDPLPENVLAQIIRPAATASPPVIVMSRTSARMRVFNDARAVLVGDIVRTPCMLASGRLIFTPTDGC